VEFDVTSVYDVVLPDMIHWPVYRPRMGIFITSIGVQLVDFTASENVLMNEVVRPRVFRQRAVGFTNK